MVVSVVGRSSRYSCVVMYMEIDVAAFVGMALLVSFIPLQGLSSFDAIFNFISARATNSLN